MVDRKLILKFPEKVILMIGDSFGSRPLPPWPTRALPGSRMKVAVMAWRYRRGYALFHPLDAKWGDRRVTPRVTPSAAQLDMVMDPE